MTVHELIRSGRRPTWAESDLAALAHNIRAIKRHAPGTEYLLPVKADAYGHGMEAVTRTAIKSGVQYFGIASTDEGMFLCGKGIRADLVILGLSFIEQIPAILRYRLIPTAADRHFIDTLDRAASKLGKRVRIHIKIDTGMGRVGVSERDAKKLILHAAAKKNIIIEGIFTHFPSSDDNVEFSRGQLARFCTIIDSLAALGVRPRFVHAANSAAVLSIPASHLSMIRPGLISYGYAQSKGLAAVLPLRPVLSLKSRIIFVKTIERGMSVSYGRTFIAKKRMQVATVPIGYEDGVSRAFSNNMEMLVHGRRVPLVGRVSMDQCMLDVTKIATEKGVHIGDEVVIIGSQGKERIGVEELAARISTIPYEITCMLSERVPLIYTR